MRSRLTILLLVFLVCGAFAPVTGQSAKMRKADALFESFAFAEAIPIYKGLLEGPEEVPASLRLAECYRLTNRLDQAEAFYAKGVTLENIRPVFLLYYAQSLQSNGKCAEAVNWYRRYSYIVPNDPRGSALISACTDITDLVGTGSDYELLPLNINTSAAELSPFIYRNGIVFTTSRPSKGRRQTDPWSGDFYYDIYFAEGDKESFRNSRSLSEKLNTPYHDGPASFSGTGNTIYFSRSNSSTSRKNRHANGGVTLQLYKASYVDLGWEKADRMEFQNPNYNYTHPTISADGSTLYFSCDHPDGLGGMDIWKVKYEKDGWGKPKPLGSPINTPGNETFPFVHDDGTLYFASDGHRGLGGLDIFKAKYSSGRFSTPVNLRSPINSTRDDFGLVFDPDKEQGYFSSNREGGKGADDLYSLTKFPLFVEGIVVADGTMDPMPGVRVMMTRGSEGQEQQVRTDSEGRFVLRVAPYQSYTVTIYQEGYNPAERKLVTHRANPEKMIVPLEKLINTEVALALEVKVIEKESKAPIADAQIFMRNERSGAIRILQTNRNGVAEITIDKSDAWTIGADKMHYFNLQERITTSATKDVRQLTRVLELEAYEIGKPILFEAVTYKHAQTELQFDAKLELDKLARLMILNPTMIIEIGSHTDSNGSDATNNRVSKGRAEEVREYLISQGVEEDRIVAVGYGETELINHCKNGVVCPEALHAENRRTEWKVLSF